MTRYGYVSTSKFDQYIQRREAVTIELDHEPLKAEDATDTPKLQSIYNTRKEN